MPKLMTGEKLSHSIDSQVYMGESYYFLMERQVIMIK